MKIFNIFWSLFICFLLFSCGTRIPETDNTPPTFSFQITGDGFQKTFTQEDLSTTYQLNMNENATFSIVFSGLDNGGISRATWEFSHREIELFGNVQEGWILRPISTFNNAIEFLGQSSTPVNAFVLNQRFGINEDYFGSGVFRIRVRDYGGASGTENLVSYEIQLSIGDFPTELIRT
ncbi:hypothetical protein ACFS5M_11335 [Lacinutrix iliipiscaria]|uniref:Lipoprotein n=1 Tax=Lacinutrix iliipiscaria TaxID=1230532 RepID=A0ABW5WQM2_9FLAO